MSSSSGSALPSIQSGDIAQSIGWGRALAWFQSRGWAPHAFQMEVWKEVLDGKDGLLNAPTGSGKTYSLWVPFLIRWINEHGHPANAASAPGKKGLKVIWVTPLRSLTRDIARALQSAATEMDVPYNVGIRTGDTSAADKKRIKQQMPEALVTTPESMHVMLSQVGYESLFSELEAVIFDEWHELLGSKRGVQAELALSRLRALRPRLQVWSISATIGNLDQALEVMRGFPKTGAPAALVKSEIEKQVEVCSILPPEIERFPWAGHLGLNMIAEIIPIIRASTSTLLFINTRGQSEVWYRALLEAAPDLAGQIALHHGSLDKEVRDWVEDALHAQRLKLCVCTSTLDLGVDFAPVDTVIQVGSPKGVNRFLQRAGRSGHRPGAVSRIYFVPTHALELIEAAAIKWAINKKYFESRLPLQKPLDVLIQYLGTLAAGGGFIAEEVLNEVRSTYTYAELSKEEFEWCLAFLIDGSNALKEYDEYEKIGISNGRYYMANKRVAFRHRMSIGTIVSDPMISVKLQHGSYIGQLEESFISRLSKGDKFWFSGRPLEFIRVREMTAFVKIAKNTKGTIPSWQGARMSLSNRLAFGLILKLTDFTQGKVTDPEIEALSPLLWLQHKWSRIPTDNVLLIEQISTEEGHHLFFYPFAGRAVHEGLAALTAFRLAARQPITFSIAMNDYGFELSSDTLPDIERAIDEGLFSEENMHADMQQSVNGTEMAKRRFREIAQIAGLIFTGYPGKMKRNKQLQASSSLLFDVFRQYDPENLLLKQAYHEVYSQLLNEAAMEETLRKINKSNIIITHPQKVTPFAFPILVDSMRDKLSSEKLTERIRRMQASLELSADEETEEINW